MSLGHEIVGPLGECPLCGQEIPRHSHLISYQRDGWPTMFAECSECKEVVRPR